jgi:YVTN family beta-propeller protein
MNHLPIDPTADKPTDGSGQQPDAVVATVSLGGRAGEVVTSPTGDHVYVMVGDSVKVVNRLHRIVAAYRTGVHPKYILASADGSRVYVTGYDGSTSVITVADNTVKTVVLDRSTAEVVSPDGDHIYLLHSGIVGDIGGSWVSVVNADGATVAIVPVDRHAIAICPSPDGSRLYVSSRHGSSYLDWRGSISVIDTGTYRVIDKIPVELAPDTLTVSHDPASLYGTHYHKNAISIFDLETREVARWVYGDAPIDIALSPDGCFAYVTNLHSLSVFNTAANRIKNAPIGKMPRATRLSPDGKRAYVVDFVQRAIRALDTADNVVIATLGVGGHPEAMALAPDGEFLYLTDSRADTLAVISTALLKRTATER